MILGLNPIQLLKRDLEGLQSGFWTIIILVNVKKQFSGGG